MLIITRNNHVYYILYSIIQTSKILYLEITYKLMIQKHTQPYTYIQHPDFVTQLKFIQHIFNFPNFFFNSMIPHQSCMTLYTCRSTQLGPMHMHNYYYYVVCMQFIKMGFVDINHSAN